jgi:hypothetical protein
VFHRSQRVGSHLRSYQRGVDHDAAGPYADIAPGTCGMDADQPHQLGRSIGANTCAVVEHLQCTKEIDRI